MKIEHVALYVNDLEAAKDFFVRYLDAMPNEGYHNPRTDFRSYFLTFADGARLELMNKPGMADEPKPAARTGYAHIAFSVGSREKVDVLTARLKADGLEVLSGPRTTGDGYYESCVLAVEGNQIEITVKPKRAEPAVKTRKSLLFLFCIYQRFRAEYRTGAGKNYKKPEIHDENIVLVAQRPVKEMRKLKLFR